MTCGCCTPGTVTGGGYTYTPIYHKECYRNKCDSCDCKSCGDKHMCETRQKKCVWCSYDRNYYWTGAQWYGTQTF